MQILALYPYIPFPLDRGAYYRGFHLLRALAREHEVDFLALSEHGAGLEQASVFRQFCRTVQFVPFRHPEWQKLWPGRLSNSLPATVAHWSVPEVQVAVDKLLQSPHYDAVHLFDVILAQYVIHPRLRVPLVIDRTRVDLQYQLMERRWLKAPLRRRVLDWENLAKLWCYERRLARRAKLQIVCGPDDSDFLRRYVRRSLRPAVIPNGVDTEFFQPSDREGRATEPTILFCGAMDYNPNIDALRWYFSEMHAGLSQLVPNLRVLLVGKDPGAEVRAYGERSNVTVTGGVPDVRPYYRRAWLQIVPLRIGGGTRLKIVESMAMGTPVVSTSIGAQGLGLKSGHDVLLADSPLAFINETGRALHEQNLRLELGQAALQTVRSRLGWDVLGKELTRTYARVFSGAPSSAIGKDSRPGSGSSPSAGRPLGTETPEGRGHEPVLEGEGRR